MPSTYTDKTSCDFRWIYRHSQSWYFSQKCCLVRTHPSCPFTSNLADGWPFRFRFKRTSGSSVESHCFGLRLSGGLLHSRGRSLCGDRNNGSASDMCACVADTASLASPAVPEKSQEIVSIWEALRESCSVSTVVFHVVPRCTPLLYGWTCLAGSERLRWQRFMRVC